MVAGYRDTFTVIIRKQAGAYIIEAIAPTGHRVKPLPLSPLENWFTAEHRATVAALRDPTGDVSTADVRNLGQVLYQAIFIQPIADAFDRAKETARDQGLRLCLQIESQSLAGLPWEAMHDGHDWLSTRISLPLVRRLPQAAEIQTLPKRKLSQSLRVLFVGASPKDLDALNVETAEAELRISFQAEAKKKKTKIDFESLLNPTLDQLQQALVKGYDILYFSGHGSPEAIYLCDKYGYHFLVSAERLGNLLDGKPTRLVFLAACNTGAVSRSGTTETGDLLESYAQKLIEQSGLPVIVAMQYYISNLQANRLPAPFLASLAAFHAVDVALAEARNALVTDAGIKRDVLAPVIYLQTDDGELFQRARNWARWVLAAMIPIVILFAAWALYSQRSAVESEKQKATAAANARAEATGRAMAEATSEIRQFQTWQEESLRQAEQSRQALAENRYQEALQLALTSIDHYPDGVSNVESRTALLNALARPVQASVDLPHENLVIAAAWSSDGTRVLSASHDGAVRVWDASNWTERLSLQHDGPINGAIWNSDESRILSWALDGTARVWDADSGAELFTLSHADGTASSVVGAAWNEDETRILTWSWDKTARVWDAGTARLLVTLNHEASVLGAAWNDPETLILTWAKDSTLRVWEADTGLELHSFKHAGDISGAVWGVDAARILSWSRKTVQIWDAATGAQLLDLAHDDTVRGAIQRADGTRLLSWSADGTVRVWDSRTGDELITLVHDGLVVGAQWNADESLILSWTGDSVQIWDAATGQRLHALPHDRNLGGAAWNADESRVLSWSGDGTVRVWDVNNEEELFVLRHEYWVLGAAWDNDESRILSWTGDIGGSSSGMARIWNIANMPEMITLRAGSPVRHAAWNATENRIMARFWDYDAKAGTIQIWDAGSGIPLLTLRHEGEVLGADWTDDGDRILSWSWDGAVKVRDADTGEVLLALDYDRPVMGAAWSQDEQCILTWTIDSAQVWDANTGESRLRLSQVGSIQGAAWSTDERYILTWSWDLKLDTGTVRVWDAETGEAQQAASFEGGVLGATWSSDNSRILAWSTNGQIRIWDLTGTAAPVNLGHDEVRHAIWNNAEDRILSWSVDGTARVWDAGSDQELLTLTHKGPVHQAAWSSDGSRIITQAGHAARVWDATSGKVLITLNHAGNVWGAHWNADESQILSWSKDGAARVWDAASGEALFTLAHRQFDPLTPPHPEEGRPPGAVLGAAWNRDGRHVLTWSDDGSVRVWIVDLQRLITMARARGEASLAEGGETTLVLPTPTPSATPASTPATRQATQVRPTPAAVGSPISSATGSMSVETPLGHCTKPTTPVLVHPDDEGVQPNHHYGQGEPWQFDWQDAACEGGEIAGYRIIVQAVGYPVAAVDQVVTKSEYTGDTSGTVGTGEWAWKVRAIDDWDRLGDWSEERTFFVPPWEE
jgi:WD40 repeat protein